MTRPISRASRPALGLALLLSLTVAQETPVPATEATPAVAEPAADAAAVPEEALALSLGDALRIAMSNNLTLAVEELSVEIADADRRGSWGAFDPVFGLTANYSDSEQPQANVFLALNTLVITDEALGLDANLTAPLTTGGSFRIGYTEAITTTNNPGVLELFPDGTFANAVLSAGYTQPLLRGAWARSATAAQREAEIELRVSQARLRTVRDTLLTDVSNAYWDLVAAREEARVRQRARELGLEQLAQNRERLRVGVGTEVDVLQAETLVAQEDERLLRARANVLERSDALKRLILRRSEDREGSWEEYLDLWSLPVEPLTPLPDAAGEELFVDDGTFWRNALDQALEERPELLQALFEIDRAQVRLDRASADRLPGLDLDLNASSSAFEDTAADAFETATEFEFMTYSGSLGLELPLGNRTASYAERSARVALRAARLRLEQAEADVVSEIRSAVRSVETESQAVRAAAKSREFTQRQLEAEQARYQEGLATTFQVLEFQQQLAEAQSAEKAAQAAYARAQVALDRARGSIAERLSESGADE